MLIDKWFYEKNCCKYVLKSTNFALFGSCESGGFDYMYQKFAELSQYGSDYSAVVSMIMLSIIVL